MRVLKISQQNFKEAIKKATQSIQDEEVIICPTDTVYGLIADATNKKAVPKVFKIKKRKKAKPIPIFVKDIKMAKRLVYINKNQEEFLKKAWPGKVTVILKKAYTRVNSVQDKEETKMRIYGVAKTTIALRVPDYKLVKILLEKLNRPLTGTSANISGKPPSTKMKDILKQFPPTTFRGKRFGQRKYTKSGGEQPDLILDAGNLPKNKPSVVLDLTNWPPTILRD